MAEELQEPEEGDYVVCSIGHIGSLTGVSIVGSKHMGIFKSEDDAYRQIAGQMEREQYWPNVWYENDHGGFTPVNMAEVL